MKYYYAVMKDNLPVLSQCMCSSLTGGMQKNNETKAQSLDVISFP